MEPMVGAKNASLPHWHQEGHHRRYHQKPRYSPYKDIIGVRRCGKTTILYQVADHLTSKGVREKDIIFLNFDDPSINAASFEELQKEIFKINPDISHIFLDEIQPVSYTHLT